MQLKILLNQPTSAVNTSCKNGERQIYLQSPQVKLSVRSFSLRFPQVNRVILPAPGGNEIQAHIVSGNYKR